jgi:formamidopyrimidine-DNA glycosylase
MPELPEVETVVRLIRDPLLGRRILGAEVFWERTVGELGPDAFAARVQERTISRVWRRAKYFVLDLERNGVPDGCLVGHLRMTGRCHVEPPGFDAGPYVRLSMPLDSGLVFHFIDVRKFGRVIAADAPEQVFAELGPEPLSTDFDAASFAAELRRRRRLVKPLLLDQAFVAGLGNIYVDESLHRAGIHPLRRSDRIPPGRARVLHGEIRATLEEAIEREGSSFDAFYRTPEGQPGSYQHQFRVYGRDGQPCRTCGTAIQRIVVGQRGTHFCRRCQPVPRPRKA